MAEIDLSYVESDIKDLLQRVEALERAEREQSEIYSRSEIADIAWDRTQQYCEGILEDDIKTLKEQAQALLGFANQFESWRAWASRTISKILRELEMAPREREPG